MQLSISKQKIVDFLAVPILFLFVYRVFFIPTISTSMIITAFMMPVLLVAFANAANKHIIKKWLFTLYVLIIFMIFLSVFYPVFHGTEDFSIAALYIVMLVETLVGSLCFYYIFLKNKSLSFLCRCIVIITVLQSLIILLMFVSPAIRNFIFQNTISSGEALFEKYWGVRGFGLASSVVFDLPIILSIGMVLSSYMIFVTRRTIWFYSFAWIINFVCVMMTGRTGLFGAGLSLLLLLYAFRNKVTLKRTTSFLFGIFLILLSSFFFLLAVLPENVVELFNTKVIRFAFEMFINVSATGRFGTSSTDVLFEMYFPISLGTFFLGDGYFMSANGAYYMGTDGGYMRHVLFYGIFPSLILYFSYAFGFLAMARKIRYDKLFSVIILLLGGYFFIAHYKGELFLSAMLTKIFFILLIYIFYSKKTNIYTNEYSLLTTIQNNGIKT